MKIVFLHAGGGMGDLLLSYPAVEVFHKAYPKAGKIFVVSPDLEEPAKANPLVSKVMVLKKGWRPAWELVRALRAERIDAACAFWTTARAAWILRLAGIPVRIGQAGRRLSSFLFTHRVEVRSARGDEESHWVECLLDYPRILGIQPGQPRLRVGVPPQVLEKSENLLREIGVPDSGPRVVLHCGKGEKVLERGWPVEKFARLADELSQNGCRVVLTGGRGEIPLVENVRSRMETQGWSLAGRTDFWALAGVLKLSQAAVCPDSGPMHLAAAVGTPVVALFLMRKDFPNRWKPWGVPSVIIRPPRFVCRKNCTKETCPDFRCYREMPVEEIAAAALNLIGKR